MSKRKVKSVSQVFTLFSTRPKVGQWQLEPLQAGRLGVLEEHGNPIAVGVEEGAEICAEEVYELLYVASRGVDELAEASFLDDDGWRLELRKFSLTVTDDELEQAWEIFNDELQAMNSARTVAKKKPPRKKTTRKKK